MRSERFLDLVQSVVGLTSEEGTFSTNLAAAFTSRESIVNLLFSAPVIH
jgi:hypothetical protein